MRIIKEVVHQNTKRIWGYFILSDKSKTSFEMTLRNYKSLGSGAWFQWGNTTDNLYLTVDRVELLCNKWLHERGRL